MVDEQNRLVLCQRWDSDSLNFLHPSALLALSIAFVNFHFADIAAGLWKEKINDAEQTGLTRNMPAGLSRPVHRWRQSISPVFRWDADRNLTVGWSPIRLSASGKGGRHPRRRV